MQLFRVEDLAIALALIEIEIKQLQSTTPECVEQNSFSQNDWCTEKYRLLGISKSTLYGRKSFVCL